MKTNVRPKTKVLIVIAVFLLQGFVVVEFFKVLVSLSNQ